MVYCIAAGSISLFSREILKLVVNPRYWGATQVIPFIAFAFVMTGVSYLFVNTLYIEVYTTVFVTVATVSGMIINLLLNLFFIPRFGILGAAFSSFLSNFLYLLIIIAISKKYDRIKMNFVRFILTIWTSFGISLIPFFFQVESIFLSLLIKLVLAMGLLFLTGFILVSQPLYFLKIIKILHQFLIKRLYPNQ